MPRIHLLAPEEMTKEQRSAYDATVAGRRGRAPAPFLAWLSSPELANRAQRLGEFVRYETSLPPRLSELAILVVARHWTSHYEWAIHRDDAARAGLSSSVIDDIARRHRPGFERADERVVFDFTMTLLEHTRVPDDLYREATTEVGERGVVELVGLLGYYTLISMTLNVFEIGPPPGATTLA